jgi:hypothetical protein
VFDCYVRLVCSGEHASQRPASEFFCAYDCDAGWASLGAWTTMGLGSQDVVALGMQGMKREVQAVEVLREADNLD